MKKIEPRFSIFSQLVIAFCLFAGNAHAWELSSAFRGPVRLNVWRHWQASWNVEESAAPREVQRFLLERGRVAGQAEVRLAYFGEGDSAQIECEAYERKDLWRVEESRGPNLSADPLPTILPDGSVHFRFSRADSCLDETNKRIVTKIRFKVLLSGVEKFSYSLLPMYVRGKEMSYWDNPIDPYSAHAGTGSIRVATAMSGESGWDRWDGVLVKPTLSFVDRNQMQASGTVGLHRHEANQELYFIESGTAEMHLGMAPRASSNRAVSRVWDSAGGVANTEEFSAEGGWLETRTLRPGEISVIVPNGENRDMVYFHGISAKSDLIFWTMGAKN